MLSHKVLLRIQMCLIISNVNEKDASVAVCAQFFVQMRPTAQMGVELTIEIF